MSLKKITEEKKKRKKVLFTIRLDADLNDELREFAEADGVNNIDVIEEGIRLCLKKHKLEGK